MIAAPERFDLVGLAGEMRPLELRARDSGGEWSDWVEAADGDPVYFGGADEVQLRTRGWRPSGTLHYVNVSGTTSAAGGLLTGVREAINSAFISAGSLVDADRRGGAARAGDRHPQRLGREPDPGRLSAAREARRTARSRPASIHHTVTANDYSEAEAPGIVLGDLPLPPQRQRLERHRLPGPRRPLRQPLRRARGRHAQGRDRRPRPGLQLADDRRSPRSAPTPRTAPTGCRPGLDRRLPGLEARASTGSTATGKTTLTSAGGDLSRYPAGRRVRLNKVIGHGTLGYTACPGEALERLIVGSATQDPGADRGLRRPGDPPITTPPGGGVEPR